MRPVRTPTPGPWSTSVRQPSMRPIIPPVWAGTQCAHLTVRRSSMDVRAAVDVVGDAGDVAGLFPAQVGDDIGDVVHIAGATDRDAGEQLGFALVIQLAGGDVG